MGQRFFSLAHRLRVSPDGPTLLADLLSVRLVPQR